MGIEVRYAQLNHKGSKIVFVVIQLFKEKGLGLAMIFSVLCQLCVCLMVIIVLGISKRNIWSVLYGDWLRGRVLKHNVIKKENNCM